MGDLWRFLQLVWSSYLNDLSLIEQVLVWGPLAAIIVSLLLALRNAYRGKNRALALELADEKASSRKWLRKYHEASTALESANKQLPENWAAAALADRQQGNVRLALGVLQNRMDQIGPHIAGASDELAAYYATAFASTEQDVLQEALRYARLAIYIGGPNAERVGLLDELVELSHERALGDKVLSPWDDPYLGVPEGVDATEVLDVLNEATYESFNKQHYRIAARLNDRARLIADKCAQPQHPSVLLTRLLTAQSFIVRGMPQEALEAIEGFEAIQAAVLADDDASVFASSHAKAQALLGLGRPLEALAEIDDLAPRQRRALGTGHSDVISTGHVKARILLELGRPQEAIDLLEQILQLDQASLAVDDATVLKSRFLRAEALDQLGRSDMALELLRQVEEQHLKQVPQLGSQMLQVSRAIARCLAHLRLDAEALERYQDIVQEFPVIEGGRTTTYFGVRAEYAQLLAAVGRLPEALAEVESFASEQKRRMPADHPDILLTDRLLAEFRESQPAQPPPTKRRTAKPRAKRTESRRES